jgi:hypothetical protein
VWQGLEIRTDEYSDGSLMDEVMQLMLQVRLAVSTVVLMMMIMKMMILLVFGQANDWDIASGGKEDPDVQVS